MSEDNLEAAKELLQSGRIRSSISRAYYAAYCAVTEKLVAKGMRFPFGWNNPAHEQVIQLIRDNLPLSPLERRRILTAFQYLRATRESADYRPGIAVERGEALDSLYYARQIIEAMETIR